MTHRGPFQPLPFCDSVILDKCPSRPSPRSFSLLIISRSSNDSYKNVNDRHMSNQYGFWQNKKNPKVLFDPLLLTNAGKYNTMSTYANHIPQKLSVI